MAESSSFLSPQFLPTFIDAYRRHRCLWQVKSSEYSNRALKEAAYKDLIQLTRKVIPNCDINFVKRKIDILRGSFRREYKKVKVSTKEGGGIDSGYKPKLWYFNMLLFLKDQEESGQLTAVQEDPLAQDFQEAETFTEDDEDANPKFEVIEIPTPTYEHHKRLRYENAKNLQDEVPYLAHHEDEFDKFGAVVAAKLRRMAAVQEIYAENLINQVLFNGMMGRLQESSTVNTHD